MIVEYGMRVVGPRASMTEEEIEKLTAYGSELDEINGGR